MAAVPESLKRIFHDLHNIEVNVILKTGMTGRKMPEAREALTEIAVAYDVYLGGASTLAAPALTGNPETFADLQRRVMDENPNLKTATPKLDDGRTVMLRRIWRNCDELRRILTERAAGELRPADLLVVRKVWEVGTEEIVMQSVVQLDGDIVTRIDRARVAASAAPVQELHRTILESAIGHWQFLFRTLAELTSETLQRFLPR